MKLVNWLEKLKILKVLHDSSIQFVSDNELKNLFGFDTKFKKLSNNLNLTIFPINYYKTNMFEYALIRKLEVHKRIDICKYKIFNISIFKKENIAYDVFCRTQAKLIGIRLDFANGSSYFDKNKDHFIKVVTNHVIVPMLFDNNFKACKIESVDIRLNYDNAIYNLDYMCNVNDYIPLYTVNDLIVNSFLVSENDLKYKLVDYYINGDTQHRVTNLSTKQLKEMEI